MYQRDTLLKELRSNVVEVHFTKVNGESRVMRATLMEKFLPESHRNEKTEENDFHQRNPNIIACWDITSGGWRTFRIDSVTYCQGVETF
jgi:hypothetical protein